MKSSLINRHLVDNIRTSLDNPPHTVPRESLRKSSMTTSYLRGCVQQNTNEREQGKQVNLVNQHCSFVPISDKAQLISRNHDCVYEITNVYDNVAITPISQIIVYIFLRDAAGTVNSCVCNLLLSSVEGLHRPRIAWKGLRVTHRERTPRHPKPREGAYSAIFWNLETCRTRVAYDVISV